MLLQMILMVFGFVLFVLSGVGIPNPNPTPQKPLELNGVGIGLLDTGRDLRP